MKIKVGPHRIDVRPLPRGGSSDQGVYGHYLPTSAAIEVSADMAPTRQAEILLHEVLHAVWDVQGIAPKVDEETAVNSLAKGLLQVFVDNGALVPLLVAAAGPEGVAIFGKGRER